MRDFGKVISAMIVEIPKGEKLRDGLERVAFRAAYSAPECSQPHWEVVGHLINDNLPSDYLQLNSWQKKVVDIWTDKIRV